MRHQQLHQTFSVLKVNNNVESLNKLSGIKLATTWLVGVNTVKAQ